MKSVRLLKEHRINRIAQPIGYEVALPDELADWLAQQGVVELIGAVTRKVAAPVVQPTPRPKFVAMQPRWTCCGGLKQK